MILVGFEPEGSATGVDAVPWRRVRAHGGARKSSVDGAESAVRQQGSLQRKLAAGTRRIIISRRKNSLARLRLASVYWPKKIGAGGSGGRDRRHAGEKLSKCRNLLQLLRNVGNLVFVICSTSRRLAALLSAREVSCALIGLAVAFIFYGGSEACKADDS